MVSDLVSLVIQFDSSDEDCSRCIKSISEQSYSNVEIIIIGKKEPVLASNIHIDYSFVQSDNSFYDPRTLLDESRDCVHGDYVLFMNSKCCIFPECLEYLIKSITSSGISMLLVGYYYVCSKLVVVRIPDSSEIPTFGRYPFFVNRFVIESGFDIESYDHSKVGVVKTPLLVFVDKVEEKMHKSVLLNIYYYVRGVLFNIINRKLIRDNSEKMKGLKDQFKGKRCFILGNGPSLIPADLERLRGEYTFASNGIIKMYKYTSWRPTFFVISDHIAMKDYFEKAQSSGAEYSFFKLDYKKDITDLEPSPILFRSESAFFDGYPPNCSEDASKCIYSSTTVTYINLQFALYFGFTEIYLLGVDHAYPLRKAKDGVRITQVKRHCYEEQYKDGDEWFLPDLDTNETSYALCNEIAKRRGVKIYNATRGGALETLERVDFDSLFD